MATSDRVFQILENNKGTSVSGEFLADTLGISRTAVWKAVDKLRKEGHIIDAIPNRGYCLSPDSNILSKESIEEHLNVNVAVKVFGQVSSTNDMAVSSARQGASPGTVLIANEQTGGKGRRGRSFYSPPGTGLYMSFILKPTFDLSQGELITTATSLAVARALKKVCGISPQIKWVNDVYIGNKKVCGILTEGVSDLESGRISHLVVGIGVNCSTKDFPDDITGQAGSIGAGVDRNRLAAQIINELMVLSENLRGGDFIKEYKKLSMIIGKNIKVYKHDDVLSAKAVDIDSTGGLLVRYADGTEETLSTGEVTIRNE